MATQAEIVEATNQLLIPNYGRLPMAIARGQGARVWDADGREYLDFFPGFGACGVGGHCHPKIVSAIRDQAERILACGNLFTNQPQIELARAITDNAFGGKVFYCLSGAEANEAALKLTRLAAGEGRYKILSFHNCFHGRTMGSLSLTPEKYHKGFEPMLPGNVKMDFGDMASVEATVDDETAGIIIEPIQGEGGVNIPTAQFMQALRAMCDRRGILLICDEVWTAPARTGKWFAYQHFGIEPDIMTLGKATGGGVPVGAMIAAPKWADLLQPGTHGCTMGGAPLCAAAGVATMNLIAEEDLLTRAVQKGARITDAVNAAGCAIVREVRGKGMMIGIELDRPGADIFKTCLDRGLIINCAQETVLRLAAPLTIADAELDQGLDILLDVLKAQS